MNRKSAVPHFKASEADLEVLPDSAIGIRPQRIQQGSRDNEQAIAWHYTTGAHFVLIVTSGVLLPEPEFDAPQQRPILWFSLNQNWEETANKGWVVNGKSRRLSREETRQKCGNLVRFGCEVTRLQRWPHIGLAAGIPRKMRRALESIARAWGSSPDEWAGTLDVMGIDTLLIDVWEQGTLSWVRVHPASSGESFAGDLPVSSL